MKRDANENNQLDCGPTLNPIKTKQKKGSGAKNEGNRESRTGPRLGGCGEKGRNKDVRIADFSVFKGKTEFRTGE